MNRITTICKPLFLASLLTTGMLAVAGCHSDHNAMLGEEGKGLTSSSSTGEFSEIELIVNAEMQVTVGPAASVQVLASPKDLENILVEIEDGELVISSRDGKEIDGPVKIVATTPKLTSIDVVGTSEVEISGVTGENFEVEISGSGEVEAAGEVKNLMVEVAGSGEVELFDLKAENVEVEIAGSADVEVSATKSLNAEIAGSGNISYKGTPAEIETEVAGSGSIVRVE